jgi:hypothetical protein
MIYGFAKQSGGQVRIYSEVGTGTSVRIYLPRHYGETEPEVLLAEPAETHRAEVGETVLIVDDEPSALYHRLRRKCRHWQRLSRHVLAKPFAMETLTRRNKSIITAENLSPSVARRPRQRHRPS